MLDTRNDLSNLKFLQMRKWLPVTYSGLLVVEPVPDLDLILFSALCHTTLLIVNWNHLGIFKNTDSYPLPRHSDLIGMGWNLSIGIFKSSKFENLLHKGIIVPKDLEPG